VKSRWLVALACAAAAIVAWLALAPSDDATAARVQREIEAAAKTSSGDVGGIERAAVDEPERAKPDYAPSSTPAAPEATELAESEGRWLELFARTPDGQPYYALADDLGLQPEDVFASGFRAYESRGTPGDWHALPDARAFALTERFQTQRIKGGRDDERDDYVGRVLRERGATSWIGLAFHDRFLGWQFAAADAEQLVFEFASDAVRGTFSSLTLRVVDALERKPIAGARVDLMAEVSALRRADTSDVAVDADGRVRFEPLLPDDYDLVVSVESGGELRQRVTVPPHTAVDLGDVELSLAPPIEVTVRDESGRPLNALLETGPLVRGKRLDELFSPRVSTTDDQGRERIPVPSVPTVVRARQLLDARRFHLGNSSPLILIDPAAAPQTLEIVIGAQTLLDVRAPRLANTEATLFVEHDFGVYVHVQSLAHGDGFDERLPSGRYRVRLVDADGREVESRAVEIFGERFEVRF
jgi:hypothetical protein